MCSSNYKSNTFRHQFQGKGTDYIQLHKTGIIFPYSLNQRYCNPFVPLWIMDEVKALFYSVLFVPLSSKIRAAFSNPA